MCIRWFKKHDPPPIQTNLNKRALLFAINNYTGSANDLKGCLNDQKDFAAKLEALWPGEYDIRKFSDSAATCECYKREVANAIALMHPGGLVNVISDSCFSGTNTKFISTNPTLVRNRFFLKPDLPPRRKVNIQFAKGNGSPMKWLAFAGCQENQTCADAAFNSRPNGAFSYYFLKALRKGMTWKDLESNVRAYLPSKALEFDQEPYLEGPDQLAYRVIGEGEELWIVNSTHGSQVYDINGDEGDGYDETIYLHNGDVTDDEINALLQQIPVLT